MHPIVRLQLVLEAELLATAIALVGFLACVDAFVALERALISEAAATELTLVWVVACGDKGLVQLLPTPGLTSGDRRTSSVHQEDEAACIHSLQRRLKDPQPLPASIA